MNLRFSTALFAALAMTSLVFAQAPGPGGGTADAGKAAKRGQAREKIHRTIIAELNLTEEQKSAVEVLDAKRKEEMSTLQAEVKSGSLDRAAARPKLKAIATAYFEAFAEVLTPSQQETYRARMKEELAKLKKAGGGKGGGKI